MIQRATIPENAQAADDAEASGGNGLLPQASLLADVIEDEKLCEQIGAAWGLYFRLVLIEGGRMTGTYEEIGQAAGAVGRTARNWVARLRKAGIATVVRKGHQVCLELSERHMAVALAPRCVVRSQGAEQEPMSTRMRDACRLLQAAETAGTPVEVKTVIEWKR